MTVFSEPAAGGTFEDFAAQRWILGGTLRIAYDADGVPILTTAKERVETSLPYTVDDADCLVIINAGANGTVNLPALADVRGLTFLINRMQAETVTIDPNASETIGGSTTLAVAAVDDTVWCHAPLAGTDWLILHP